MLSSDQLPRLHGETTERFTDGDVNAFAKVVWPDPKTDCVKFIEDEYVFHNNILDNGYLIVMNEANVKEQLLEILKNMKEHKKSVTLYLGILGNDYVIFKDAYEGIT